MLRKKIKDRINDELFKDNADIVKNNGYIEIIAKNIVHRNGFEVIREFTGDKTLQEIINQRVKGSVQEATACV